MAGDFLSSRGQLSVEFAMILIVMILYITTLIQPNIILAEIISKETFGLGYTTLAAEKVVSTIDFVQSSGGATRQTINVFIPNNGILRCIGYGPNIDDKDENQFRIKFELKSGFSHDDCPNDDRQPYNPICQKTFFPKTKAGLDCGTWNEASGIGGPAHLNLRISKETSNPAEPVAVKILIGS